MAESSLPGALLNMPGALPSAPLPGAVLPGAVLPGLPGLTTQEQQNGLERHEQELSRMEAEQQAKQ